MPTVSREDGFTAAELLVSVALILIVAGAALTTFGSGLRMNDSAALLADANQNLRAGTNQLIRDVMQAGRIIGPGGIPMPAGGAQPFLRPGPVPGLTFNLILDPSNTMNLPSITTGYQLGPTINGSTTDIITIMTVDEFMPVLQTPPANPGAPTPVEGTIAPDGQSVTLPSNSLWLVGDPVNDSPPIQVGDLVLFKNPSGLALLTVTGTDATHLYFAPNGAADFFRFNQFSATQVPIMLIKQPQDTTSAWTQRTSMFRALMITYYVSAQAGQSPRLMRQVNNFAPQALAGVVDDFDLSYDLVDGVNNPTRIPDLPYTDPATGTTYTANQIRKVNLHMGVRSEATSALAGDYMRNHISTAVDVRSLASVDRYVAQ